MSTDNGQSTTQILLEDLSNPFQSKVQGTSILVALGIALGTTSLIAVGFSLIRPHHNAVYAPKLKHADKKHAPPPIGSGMFAWVDPIAKTKEMELVEKIGMDGAIFLRFTKMLRNVLVFLSIVGCGVLIPVHILYSNSNRFGDSSPSKRASTDDAKQSSNSFLYKMTPQSVTGSPMWAHVVYAYVADAIILYFLWSNYKAVVRLRRVYFESPEYQNAVHARSLMITEVKPALRTDEGLLKILDSTKQVPSIPTTAIARNMKELPDLLEEHDETVRNLEAVLAKYLKNPDKLPPKRPTMRAPGKAHGKIDAIDYLTNRIQELEVRIKDVRETIDKRNPEPYGFATYESVFDAHEVAWQSRRKTAEGSTIVLSPTPKEIIWKNMRLSKAARNRKRVITNLWVALLTAFYIVPNAFIAIFLANLGNLAAIWPAFAATYQGNQALWGVVQAILSPALFSLFYLFLPSIFRRLSQSAGDQTKTSRERHVIHKLYAFFVFNNLIVFSIFSGLWGFVTSIIKAAQGSTDVWATIKSQTEFLPMTLLSAMCTVSPFWIVWLLQRNLGAAIDLAQLVNMSLQWFKRHFMAPTPREVIELTAPPPFDYASYYNYFLYYVTVATCFSTIQPIVLPITMLYFAVDAVLKKYLLMYVFITKTESGGLYWNVLHNRMLFATLLQNVVGALVIYGATSNWHMIVAMAPLPFVLLGFKIWIGNTVANQARYYTRTNSRQVDGAEEALPEPKKKVNRVSSRLMNPVMTKPLITPMVHAKAQHMLAQIYRGRVDSDAGYGGGVEGYGSIPMSDMGNQPGRSAAATGVPNMFEVVNEADLDFANFKNRAEFREEFGGGGELYGRAPDTMTERSGTPASFLTDGAGSEGDLTRTGTPEPMPLGNLRDHPAFRAQQPMGHYGVNPAQGYRSDSFGSDTGQQKAGFYRQYGGVGSARRLVGAAQPMGYAPVGSEGVTPAEELSEHETYGLDRWRTGGSGYDPVSGDLAETDYDRYRRTAKY